MTSSSNWLRSMRTTTAMLLLLMTMVPTTMLMVSIMPTPAAMTVLQVRVQDRTSLADKFNNEETPNIILLSMTAGGIGINL